MIKCKSSSVEAWATDRSARSVPIRRTSGSGTLERRRTISAGSRRCYRRSRVRFDRQAMGSASTRSPCRPFSTHGPSSTPMASERQRPGRSTVSMRGASPCGTETTGRSWVRTPAGARARPFSTTRLCGPTPVGASSQRWSASASALRGTTAAGSGSRQSRPLRCMP